jgi:hypothetical protein
MTPEIAASILRCYAPVVEKFLAELHRDGRVHGSRLRDLMAEQGLFSFDSADTILEALWPTKILIDVCEPTISQSAFFGLYAWRKHPGFVGGAREHYWFTAPR